MTPVGDIRAPGVVSIGPAIPLLPPSSAHCLIARVQLGRRWPPRRCERRSRACRDATPTKAAAPTRSKARRSCIRVRCGRLSPPPFLRRRSLSRKLTPLPLCPRLVPPPSCAACASTSRMPRPHTTPDILAYPWKACPRTGTGHTAASPSLLRYFRHKFLMPRQRTGEGGSPDSTCIVSRPYWIFQSSKLFILVYARRTRCTTMGVQRFGDMNQAVWAKSAILVLFDNSSVRFAHGYAGMRA